MMKKTIIAVAASTALLSGVAMAQGATTGLVTGLQAGYAKFVPNSGIPVGISSTSVGTAKNGGLYFGGILGYDYAINSMVSVGVETGLNYGHNIADGSDAGSGLGSSSYSLSTSTLDIPVMATVKFYVPHTGGLNVFAKGGYAYNRQKTTGSVTASIPAPTTVSLNSTNTQWNPIAVGGVGYQIDSFNVFTQYTYIFGTKTNSTSGSAGDTAAMNALTAGVTYTIPM